MPSRHRYRDELLALDWRSPNEFGGIWCASWKGRSPRSRRKIPVSVFESDMLGWALASAGQKSGRLEQAEERLRRALLHDDGVIWGLSADPLPALEQVGREREKRLNEATLHATGANRRSTGRDAHRHPPKYGKEGG